MPAEPSCRNSDHAEQQSALSETAAPQWRQLAGAIIADEVTIAATPFNAAAATKPNTFVTTLCDPLLSKYSITTTRP
jgi:hypothetical protein